ncbi:uncharacterized protein LOC106072678 [Biomphalaria glabrata]|uniref:Uncharacterized protein LOC106072678 n=1 Tax=Biomphalaria glabrata TaxID=6526 RepID=A0A9U8EIE6_BIOGL|nr:uncharacterized protein LOC106072678 [Biomphalaria glabrata]
MSKIRVLTQSPRIPQIQDIDVDEEEDEPDEIKFQEYDVKEPHDYSSHLHADDESYLHVPHDGHTDHVDFDLGTDQSDLIGELAHLFALCALLMYGYTLIGCYIFSPGFIRQLAYILQTIRLSLTLATLLPCVTHWQAYQIVPNMQDRVFPFAVIGLLVGNVLLAVGFQKLARWLIDRYNNFNSSCSCSVKRQTCKAPRYHSCFLSKWLNLGAEDSRKKWP